MYVLIYTKIEHHGNFFLNITATKYKYVTFRFSANTFSSYAGLHSIIFDCIIILPTKEINIARYFGKMWGDLAMITKCPVKCRCNQPEVEKNYKNNNPGSEGT